MIYNGGNSMYDVICHLDKKNLIKSYKADPSKNIEKYTSPTTKKYVNAEPSNNAAIYAQQTSVDPMY